MSVGLVAKSRRIYSRTITAPKPDKLINKGRYGISLWVHLLLEKFHSQRPISRTIEQLYLQNLGAQLAVASL